MHLRRFIVEKTLRSISATFPVLLLTGPRQIGKTTLLTRMADENRKVVSLDNPTIRAMAKKEPELFLQRYAPSVGSSGTLYCLYRGNHPGGPEKCRIPVLHVRNRTAQLCPVFDRAGQCL